MNIFVFTTIVLILSQLLLQSYAYNKVPDLTRVRRREDAGDAEFVALDFIGLVEEQGRRVEQHNITTEDGYKLKLFRVPPNPSTIAKSGKNPVIFLQHGLAATADCFVVFGPENSLAFILSDAGYDVWLGNVRGNTYCREHETLFPNQAAFWDFSLDEYSTIDLPTQIDYTMSYTGHQKITYIAHSLGTTTVLMLLAEKPEYIQKLDLVVHFAPVSYWITRSPLRNLMAYTVQTVQKLIDPTGTTEFLHQTSAVAALYTRFCAGNNILNLCWLPIALAVGHDPEQVDIHQVLGYFNYYPAGISAKCAYQYRQMYQSRKFRKYDYENVAVNMKHYGQPEPPEYDLSHVDVPTVIFQGTNDPLSTPADTKALISHLHPNTSLIYQEVPSKYFNHIDFIVAKDVKKLVYNQLMQILTTFHEKQLP